MTTTLTVSEPVETSGRAEWLAARRKGIGGSDLPAILGMSRWDSAYSVWQDKTGRAAERHATWRMRHGTALEPLLAEWFTETTGVGCSPVVMQRNIARPWMLGTPDRLADDDGIVEFKTAGTWMRDDWSEGAADYAVLQGQWYCAVTGAPHLWVVAAVGDDDPVIERVERDDALIATMIHAAETFWRDHVLADVEPPLTFLDRQGVADRFPSVVTTAPVYGGPDLDFATKRRAQAVADIKHAEQVKEQAEAEIIAAIGEADTLVIDGQVAATRKQQTSRVLDRRALENEIDISPWLTDRATRVLRVPDPAKRKLWKV